MLLSVLLSCVTALVMSAAALVGIGHRLRLGSRVVSVAVAAVFVLAVGEVATRFWRLPYGFGVAGAVWLMAVAAVVIALRPLWNPVGQLFFASTAAAAVAYLALVGWATIASGLSPLGALASGLLWVLEAVAFVIAASFAFESCDVVCRSRWTRSVAAPDPSYQPRVSLHVPAYAEPPDMLIETIAALEAIDYPDFEIVVIDNNTADETLWRPVEAYCAGRERVRFVHVDPWPGYKSGALNLALAAHTDPGAEIVGVIDADYLVRSDYLAATVGYFADPELGFLQTPQDYREWKGDRYLTACYDAYRYFFETAMPSRNERNSIIFGGTMGLIRRSALVELGGWDEWCITEDAEASLRMLRAGWSGLYVNESFGRGIMPLTFSALKRQMFRWCFGGVQILRKHHRSLAPWNRDPANHLSLAQRLDYFLGGLQWFGNLVGLGFTLVLAVSGILLATQGHVSLRPLIGAAVVFPLTMLAAGLVRAVWSLRHRTGISLARAGFAFVAWLSLSWTIGLACIQGLVRAEGVFLRTPKWRGGTRLADALAETRTESALAAGAWIIGALAVASGRAGVLLGTLFAWQGAVYASAAGMAWLNHRSHLPVRLERRRRAEERRERMASFRPHLALASATVSVLAVGALLAVGGASHLGHSQARLFTVPHRGSPASPAHTSTTVGARPGSGKAGHGTATTTTTAGARNSGPGATALTSGTSTPAAGAGNGAAPGSGSAIPTIAGTTPTATTTPVTPTTVPASTGTSTTVRPSPPVSVTHPTPPTSVTPPGTAPSTTNPHRP